MFSTALINFCNSERLQWKMLWDSRYRCFHSQAPGQMCFMSSLVFACLHPPEVLIYGSNRSSLAGLQENAPRAYQRDWKRGHAWNFAAHLIYMHITQTKLKSLQQQTRARELSRLVQSCPSGHPLSVGVRGSWADTSSNDVRCKQNPRLGGAIVRSLSSNTLSFSPRLARAPWWCQRFVVTRRHAVSPNVPGFGDQQRQPARTQAMGTGAETAAGLAPLSQWRISIRTAGSLIISSLYMIQHHL